MDPQTLERLRELAEACREGGWREVLAALDMGDIVAGLRGDRGAVGRAVEATGLSQPTLWRRAKLAEHRAAIMDADPRPANLSEAMRLVKRLEAEGEGGAADTDAEGEGKAEPKRRGGRQKREPVEVLRENLRTTASLLALSGAGTLDEWIGEFRDAWNAVPTKAAAQPEGAVSFTTELEKPARPEPASLPDASEDRGPLSGPPTAVRPAQPESEFPPIPFKATLVEEWLSGHPTVRRGLVTEIERDEHGVVEMNLDEGGVKGSHRIISAGAVLFAAGSAPAPGALPFDVVYRATRDRAVWLLFDEELYRATWSSLRDALRAGSEHVLIDTVPEALEGYAGRRAEAEARLADEDRRKAEQDKLDAMRQALTVVLHKPRGTVARMLSVVRGGLEVEEVKLIQARSSTCEDGALVDLTWRRLLLRDESGCHWDSRKTSHEFKPGHPVLVVLGQGDDPCAPQVYQDPAEALNLLKSSGGEVLIDTFPREPRDEGVRRARELGAVPVVDLTVVPDHVPAEVAPAEAENSPGPDQDSAPEVLEVPEPTPAEDGFPPLPFKLWLVEIDHFGAPLLETGSFSEARGAVSPGSFHGVVNASNSTAAGWTCVRPEAYLAYHVADGRHLVHGPSRDEFPDGLARDTYLPLQGEARWREAWEGARDRLRGMGGRPLHDAIDDHLAGYDEARAKAEAKLAAAIEKAEQARAYNEAQRREAAERKAKREARAAKRAGKART